MTVTAQADFVSIGQLACRLQRTVRVLESAAQSLGIQPAMRLNGVLHFEGQQVEQLTSHLLGAQQ